LEVGEILNVLTKYLVLLSDYLRFKKWTFDRYCMTKIICYKFMCAAVRRF